MDALFSHIDLPILKIGSRKNYRGYIDFILERELNEHAAVKGVDCIDRPFIAVKADLIFEDGAIQHTFSTFFQRYANDTVTWQCCGHDGQLLMEFENGMWPIEAALLERLLTRREIVVTEDEANKLRFTYDGIKKIKLREARVSTSNGDTDRQLFYAC